jgi:hypothetical protein
MVTPRPFGDIDTVRAERAMINFNERARETRSGI